MRKFSFVRYFLDHPQKNGVKIRKNQENFERSRKFMAAKIITSGVYTSGVPGNTV